MTEKDLDLIVHALEFFKKKDIYMYMIDMYTIILEYNDEVKRNKKLDELEEKKGLSDVIHETKIKRIDALIDKLKMQEGLSHG